MFSFFSLPPSSFIHSLCSASVKSLLFAGHYVPSWGVSRVPWALLSISSHSAAQKGTNLWEAHLWDPQAPELGQLMANVGLSKNHKIKFTLLSSRANQGQAFLWWIVQWDTYVTLLLVLCGEASSHGSFKSNKKLRTFTNPLKKTPGFLHFLHCFALISPTPHLTVLVCFFWSFLFIELFQNV